MKKIVKRVSFALAGAALGFAYYSFISCSSGGSAITSSPVWTVAVGTILGLLVSYCFEDSKDTKE